MVAVGLEPLLVQGKGSPLGIINVGWFGLSLKLASAEEPLLIFHMPVECSQKNCDGSYRAIQFINEITSTDT